MGKISRIFRKIVTLKPFGFWPGFIIGLVYFSYTCWWFWSVYPLILSGIGNTVLSFWIILVPFVITVLGVSLFWGFFSCGSVFLKKARPTFRPFVMASLFTIIEYLRTWFIGILWLGKNSLLGAHWTIGSPAYLLVNLGLVRQSSSWWGIYGIDFLIVFLGTTVLLLAHAKSKTSKATLSLEIIFVIFTLALIGQISPKPNDAPEGDKLSVAIIQTENPTRLSYTPGELLIDFSQKDKLLKEASKMSDVVVFPETTDFSKTLSGFLNPSLVQKYFSSLSKNKVLIIDDNRISEQGSLKSKALLIDSREGIAGFYDKRLLTPGGEYLPYILNWPLLIFERALKNNFISSGAIFASGKGDGVLSHEDKQIKLLICSDVMSPNISRDGNFGFIVALSNMGIFSGNKLISQEFLSAARFRAAENGKYLILSSNYTHSYIIDPSGKVTKSTPTTGYQILTGDVIPNNIHTWYNKLGDWPILLLSTILLFAWLIFAFIDVKKK